MGHIATGSDLATTGHHPKNVWGSDLVVHTAAAGEDNPEIIEAKRLGIPLVERAEFLASIAHKYENLIAVSGTHGKTTATAMLAEIFKPKNPTVHIGGDYEGCTDYIGGKQFFITEACEYKKSFLYLYPSFALVLNAELDHTDCYSSYTDYFDAFKTFCRQSKAAAVFGDDLSLSALAKKYGYISFGLDTKNDIHANNIRQGFLTSSFEVVAYGQNLGTVTLKVGGTHNIQNALGAIAAALHFGLSFEDIQAGLLRFKTVGRRFEFLGEINGTEVYSDYAHHPTEIDAMIREAKESGKKVVVVFEPHTYTRTKSLYKEFADSLSKADRVYLMPIYSARETPIDGVTSDLIVKEMQTKEASAQSIIGYSELFKDLSNTLIPNENILVFCGAGTIDTWARKFCDL